MALKSNGSTLFFAISVGLCSLLPFGGASAQTTPSDNAQTVPTDFAQEVMIKSMISALSDAIITSDYSVFRAQLAKPFQDAYSADQLKDTFKPLAVQDAYMGVALAMKPISTETAKIDADGVLDLKGYFRHKSEQNKV
jgi:hypothetical protein